MEPPELETELREYNDLQLRSGRIVETKRNNNVHIEDPLPVEQTLQKEKVVQQQNQQPIPHHSQND